MDEESNRFYASCQSQSLLEALFNRCAILNGLNFSGSHRFLDARPLFDISTL